MTEESEELAELKAIVKNEREVDDEEQLTEEELQQALSSPSLHRHLVDEESTECDDYELSEANAAANDEAKCPDSDTGKGAPEELVVGQVTGPPAKPGEYQFQMLEHHIFKGKHGKKLYKCDVCFAVYRHSFSLKRHFIRSHINYGYLCETDVTNCGINLAQSASLQTWKQNNNGQKPTGPDLPDLYCCHSCVLFYDDLSQIKAHVDDCHRNNSSGTIEPIRIPCSDCNMSFIQRHNLMRHIEVVHNGKRLYACKHCSKKFQTITDRKKHEKSQHPSKVEDTADELAIKASTVTTATAQRPTTGSHRCLKCSQVFNTYPELRGHVTKKHKEFYNPCGFCTKFCFSKKQLSSHLRQKHEKTAKENGRALRQKAKTEETTPDEQPSTAVAPPMSQQNQLQAYFHCTLCYRRFVTYGSLIRHKQVAHRPQHVRSCSRLTADRLIETEVVEPYNTRHEFEFYRNLAQKVAENLLYFVDGKFVNPSNDYKMVRSPNLKKSPLPCPSLPALNLSKYNFPSDFTPESSPPPTAEQTEKLEFLYDCNLNTVKNPKFKPLIMETTSSEGKSEKDSQCQYICTVCRQKISAEVLTEHEANNHPNVYCTYIKVEPQMCHIPSQLLLWHYHSTEGLLHRCKTAPSLTSDQKDSPESTINAKCTKCQQSFASVSLLHNHILECAHNSSRKRSANKSHAETQTPITASVAVNTSDTSHSTLDTSPTPDAQSMDYSSPLSPCKTRSGKRRQISPEEYVKTKRTRNVSKSSSKIQKEINEITKQDIDSNKSDVKTPKPETSKSVSPKNSSPVARVDDSAAKSSPDSLPKRYSCKKCSKKFVYMDSLSKHQMSCNQRVINSKANTKRKLRSSPKGPNKLAKNIEIKAIKKIQKNEEKRRKSLEKADDTLNESTADDSEDKTEEEDCTDDEGTNAAKEATQEVTTKSDPTSTPTTDKTATKTSIESPQEHQCPDCLKIFIYLRNFRKHITNGCPVRKTLAIEGTIALPVTSTPLPTTTIKEEKPDADVECVDGKGCGDNDEVVIQAEHNGDEVDDSMDISISSKEESKLDLWRVKQENPQFAFKGSPAQHHSCPYCQRGFTYLANYRKHIKNICPIRLQIEEKKKQVIDNDEDMDNDGHTRAKLTEVPPTLAYTPSSLSVRSQIEDTVLTILRDQTKQNQILQSSEDLIKSEAKSEDASTTDQTALEEGDAAKTPEEPESPFEANGQDSDKSKKGNKEGKASTFKFRTFSCNICHKIFLSYVTMLKHSLSHKLSDGSLASNDESPKCEQNSPLKQKTDSQAIDGSDETIREREAANQALKATILKRTKDLFGRNSAKTVPINTTDLLEKLARGGIASDTTSTSKTSSKNTEVVTIETNNNNTNILNLQLSASTSSNDSKKSDSNLKSKSASETNDTNLSEIIINANDLGLNVLNDGDVIVSQDLQQLIAANDGKDSSDAELPVNEVLLNLDDIENANEVWITITDSSAFVQVPNSGPNGLSTGPDSGHSGS